MAFPAPLDPSLLVLDSEDEAFFKATTRIDDTQKLRNHIQGVAREAYEVSCLRLMRNVWLTSFVGVSLRYDRLVYVCQVSQGDGSVMT